LLFKLLKSHLVWGFGEPCRLMKKVRATRPASLGLLSHPTPAIGKLRTNSEGQQMVDVSIRLHCLKTRC